LFFEIITFREKRNRFAIRELATGRKEEGRMQNEEKMETGWKLCPTVMLLSRLADEKFELIRVIRVKSLRPCVLGVFALKFETRHPSTTGNGAHGVTRPTAL
jgi:hypothetical protein